MIKQNLTEDLSAIVDLADETVVDAIGVCPAVTNVELIDVSLFAVIIGIVPAFVTQVVFVSSVSF